MQRKSDTRNTGRVSFWSMFFSPLATLDSLREHPRWFYPILASAVLSAAVNYYTIQSIGFIRMVEIAFRNKAVLDTQGVLENALANKGRILMIQAATSFISPFLIALVVAAILWLMLTLLGYEIPWKKNLAVVAHANMLAIVLRELMQALTISIIPDISRFDLNNPLATNAAFFIKPASPMLSRMLLSFDALTFLNMAMIIAGLARVCPRLSKRAATMMVVIPWTLYNAGMLLAPSFFV